MRRSLATTTTTTTSCPRTNRRTLYLITSLSLWTYTLGRSSSSRVYNSRHAREVARNSALLETRGGYIESGGGDDSSVGDIDDEELDEYIEFLLQAAERKVTESENPLLKRLQKVASDAEPMTMDATSDPEPDTHHHIQLTSIVEMTEPSQKEYPEDEVMTIVDPPAQDDTVQQEGNQMSAEVKQEAGLVETLLPDDLTEEDNNKLESQDDRYILESIGTNEEIPNLEEDSASVDVMGAVVSPDVAVDETVSTEIVMDEPTSEIVVEEAASEVMEAVVSPDVAVEETISAEMVMDEPTSETGREEAASDVMEAVVSPDTAVDETISAEIVSDSPQETYPQVETTMELGVESIPEISISDKAAQIETYSEEATKSDEPLATEFFLGPSAVAESPAILEEVAAALEESSTTANADQETLGITAGTTVEELPTTVQTQLTEPGILGNVAKKWGMLTANLMGIRPVREIPQSETTTMTEESTTGSENEDMVSVYSAEPEEEASKLNVAIAAEQSKEEPTLPIDDDLSEIEATVLTTETSESPSIEVSVSLHPDKSSFESTSKDERHSEEETTSQTIDSLTHASVPKVKPSFGSRTMSSWGHWTGAMMGIKNEEDRAKTIQRKRNYARVWGQWTASFLGIDTAGVLNQARSKSKKDYDRVYEKYYVQSERQPLDSSTDAALGHAEKALQVSDEMDTTMTITNTDQDESQISDITVETLQENDLDSTSSLDNAAEFSVEEESSPLIVESASSTLDDEGLQEYEDTPTDAQVEVTVAENDIAASFDERTSAYPVESDDLSDDDSSVSMPMGWVDEDDDGVELEEDDEESDFEVDESADQPVAFIDDGQPTGVVEVADPRTLVEAETMNFFYNFLIARGLDVWLMTIVLVLEWARVYLSPFTDIFYLAVAGVMKSVGRPSLEKGLLARIRGGSSEELFDEEKEIDDASSSAEEVEASSKPGDPEDPVVQRETPETTQLPLARIRPNRLYRYLFTYGRVGHVVIMACVLLHEWVDTYLPAVGKSFRRVVAQSFPSLIDSGGPSEMPLSQTTGFVSADGTAVRGAKKRKAQMRKEDQKALNQLMNVGDAATAKYRFVSDAFMKRHGIGRFALDEERSSIDRLGDERPKTKTKHSSTAQRDDAESDSEWIVSALTEAQPVDADESVGQAVADKGPAFTVGFEIGTRKRTKRKRSVITDVTKITTVNENAGRRKNSGPRVSDRESGVMGRIRAAGANSLVGRSILGAYPGDVPSPNEAANSHGLFDLAERYGYGEWSDTEDDNEPVHVSRKKGSKPRPAEDETDTPGGGSSARGTRRRRKTSTQMIGLEFEIGTTKSKPSIVRSRFDDETSPFSSATRRKSSIVAKPTSVRQTGLDAISESATKRRKKVVTSRSDLKDPAKSPVSKSNTVIKSTSSTVAGAGLQHMKEKLERSKDNGESK